MMCYDGAMRYQWECGRGHRCNARHQPYCCPSCGWSAAEGDGGEWVDHGHPLEGADVVPVPGRAVDMTALWNDDGTPNYGRIEDEIAAGTLEVAWSR